MTETIENSARFTMLTPLVLDVYRLTARMPLQERFGLQSQIRRASISVVAKSSKALRGRVCATTCELPGSFTRISQECAYLLDLAGRLNQLDPLDVTPLTEKYGTGTGGPDQSVPGP